MVKKRSASLQEEQPIDAKSSLSNNEAALSDVQKSARKDLKSSDGSNPKSTVTDDLDAEMGDFEDAFEDEIEQEDIINPEDLDDSEMNQEADDDEEVNEPAIKAYLPGQPLAEGEVLDYDNSAYDMYHAMNVEWPCLSFDILRDNLGKGRTKFPHTTFLVSGTQADKPQNNQINIMKISRLHKTRYDDQSDAESDNDAAALDEDPIVESKTVKHVGGVNRIRVMPHEEVHVVSTWADTGKVHIWDLTEIVNSLDSPGTRADTNIKPVHTVNAHKTEGYAMAWSSRVPGRLLTGDCEKHIYLTERTASNWITHSKEPFIGHTKSVEDIQWSPAQDQIFATCSADQTIKIWDFRMKNACGASVHAHTSDVNVIAWNPKVHYLLASGADDGSFSVWDLRQFRSADKPAPAASFQWHKAPITSLEWDPEEESSLAVSGADDQLTIWDFSVEHDDEELMQDSSAPDIPPQLMFIHQGQQHIKELHWHKQIPGVLVSTAWSGFNIFKTASE